jgi:acyl-coenzyme A synthetase/AMP-(fatty) acid ligase
MSWAAALETPEPQLAIVLCRNDAATVAAILGALAAGHAVGLLDGETSASQLDRIATAFSPEILIAPATRIDLASVGGWSETGGLFVGKGKEGSGGSIHPDHAILLSTSGTTGSSKFVRLSAANIVANADQIAEALDISADDVASAHLPLHYSYGMSVLTSHLRVGGGAHLWPDSTTVPEFWTATARARVSHFPGVPFHYDFLARADLPKLIPESLRTFTQAGGALSPRLQSRMHEKAVSVGGRFYVMYGQTEASPRMTTLPWDMLPVKVGSVGKALNAGRLLVIDDAGVPLPAGEVGKIVYEGPNVMLGYAEIRADLSLGDVTGGRLDTGDLGRLDGDGYLTLTGRAKRFAKLHGLRLGLDEVEARFAQVAEVAAVDRGDRILIFTAEPELVSSLLPVVASEYKIMAANLRLRAVENLPRKPSGKIDYAALEILA